MTKCDGWRSGLDARIPFVAPVFPVAAVTAPQVLQAVDDLDAHDVLGLLVAELPLHAQAQRRAVADARVAAVHAVGEQGLRVKGIDQVEAF
ncbi:conserved hypothetical protein, partial [Ricinus communis]